MRFTGLKKMVECPTKIKNCPTKQKTSVHSVRREKLEVKLNFRPEYGYARP